MSRGNVSRGGPASHGSMRQSRPSTGGGSFGSGGRGSSRPSTQPSRQGSQQGRQDNRGDGQQGRQDNAGDRQGNRDDRFDQGQDNRDDRFDQRQDNVSDRTEFRQDAYKEHGGYYNNRNEFYENRWKWAVGATLTAATIGALSCTRTTVVVGNVTYTQCGTHWYQPQYAGGNVTYIVVNAPPGH
jgi:hypothetical protein